MPSIVTTDHTAAAKAWANFNASGTVAASYNITSVTVNGTGDYTVTIATDFSSANYAVVAMSGANSGVGPLFCNVVSIAAGTFRIQLKDSAGVARDPDTPNVITAIAFGAQ